MTKREQNRGYLLECIKRFEERLLYLRKKSRKLSLYRLTVFFISLIFFFYFFFSGKTFQLVATAVVFIIIFGILTGIHNKLDRGIKKNILWTRIKKLHISRMDLKWNELPQYIFEPDEKHPFDSDLSITGRYSIHQLINTASTVEGSKVLKDWLTNINPDRESIKTRQKLVGELRNNIRFRDKLTLNSELTSRKALTGTKILEWISSPSEVKNMRRVLAYLFAAIAVNVILFLLYIINVVPPWFYFSSLIYIALYWINGKYTKGLFDDLLVIKDEFGRFSSVFDFLESFPYKKGSRLEEFCRTFFENKPSEEFNKIRRLADAAGTARNPIAALILNLVFPYNFYLAYKLEEIKSRTAEELPLWLNNWYELEAYNSLAEFAWLNPRNNFPEISDSDEFILETEQISHPLILWENNVNNNFRIGKQGEIIIVTGSNMSGKSTFLKTLGINLVLAYAGGVVNAAFLKTSLFRIFCCINISDSVIDGISYFYAEVKRLKVLLSELKEEQELPVFFLIDEIFKGTNNVERLKGSRAYIRETARLNGTGLISTHDLELSKLENEVPSVKNYHFREEAEGTKMVFDYKLRPGPCPTTNALKIMRAEGLPTE